MPSEKAFNTTVIKWCKTCINEAKDVPRIDRVIVKRDKLNTGWLPYYPMKGNINKKIWLTFKREVDVLIGINEIIEEEKVFIPIIAIELKTASGSLGTDELDKKSAIYSKFHELYPWIHTVFIMKSNSSRKMAWGNILRNSRGFNSVFADWSDWTKDILSSTIQTRLKYALKYWGL